MSATHSSRTGRSRLDPGERDRILAELDRLDDLTTEEIEARTLALQKALSVEGDDDGLAAAVADLTTDGTVPGADAPRPGNARDHDEHADPDATGSGDASFSDPDVEPGEATDPVSSVATAYPVAAGTDAGGAPGSPSDPDDAPAPTKGVVEAEESQPVHFDAAASVPPSARQDAPAASTDASDMIGSQIGPSDKGKAAAPVAKPSSVAGGAAPRSGAGENTSPQTGEPDVRVTAPSPSEEPPVEIDARPAATVSSAEPPPRAPATSTGTEIPADLQSGSDVENDVGPQRDTGTAVATPTSLGDPVEQETASTQPSAPKGHDDPHVPADRNPADGTTGSSPAAVTDLIDPAPPSVAERAPVSRQPYPDLAPAAAAAPALVVQRAARPTAPDTALADSEAAWSSLTPIVLDPRLLARTLVITAQRTDPAHGAFDVLRTRLVQALADKGWRRVAITSPTAGCGKSFTAVNLAITLSRYAQSRTVLMDMDMRRPGLARYLGARDVGSTGDFLRGQTPLASYLRRPAPNKLQIGEHVAFGLNDRPESYAAELFAQPQTARTLAAMEAALQPSVVLFDLPPALAQDDVIAFRPHFDCVLMVVGGGITTADDIREATRRIGEDKPILGVVLNKAEVEGDYDY